MPPRSWGYFPFWEGENHEVGSLCVVRKMFPYKNMHVDHVRPRRACQYASPSVRVICWYASQFVEVIRRSGKEMYSSTSLGSFCVAVGLLLV